MLDIVSGCSCDRFRFGRMQTVDEVVQITTKVAPTKRGHLVKRGGGPRKAWVERLVLVGEGHITYFDKGQESTKVRLHLLKLLARGR